MEDRWAVALALATAAGALAADPFPLPLAVVLAAAALLARRPVLLCIAAALLASTLGARSWAGLDHPPTGRLDAVVTLVSDPEQVDAAVRVDVRHRQKRVEAWARGEEATALRLRAAGEQ